MKNLNLLLLCFFFLLNSCSKASEETPEDPEGLLRNDEGEVIAVEDEDCEDLSDDLEADVLSLASLGIDPFFYTSALKVLEKNTPSFLNYYEVKTRESRSYAKRNIISFGFSYKGIPLCESEAKVYESSDKIFLTGKVPSKDLIKPDAISIPFPISKEILEKKLESEDIHFTEQRTQCFAQINQKLSLVWKEKILREGTPYEVLGNGQEILSLEPLFFHAQGTTQVFDESDTDSSDLSVFRYYKFEGMSEGGTLCSERFRIVPGSGEIIAYSEDLRFIFDPETDPEEFEQTLMFAYAQKQSNYIESLIHTQKWYGPQVLIKPYQVNEGINNSVLYIPGDSSNPPVIQMPKGNNVSLHQVRLDNEAVQHEVGHHVLYRSVKTGRGESGILHEAIADLFVMLRTKNACLGEHLCLSDSLCTSLECLRSAENDLTLESYITLSGKHRQSQLISGFLWDIAVKVGYDKTAAWLNYAIDLLPSSAGFEDLLLALYNTLDDLFKEEQKKVFTNRCNHLMEAMEERGLDTLVEGLELSCQA